MYNLDQNTPSKPKVSRGKSDERTTFWQRALKGMRSELQREEESSKSYNDGVVYRLMAKNALYDAEKLVNASDARNQGVGAMGQFGARLRDELLDVDTYTMGVLELYNAMTLNRVAHKLRQHNNDLGEMSRSEQLLLNAAAMRDSVRSELDSSQTTAQQVGAGVGELLPAAGQFLLTSGVGAAVGAAAKKGSKKVMIKQLVSNPIQNRRQGRLIDALHEATEESAPAIRAKLSKIVNPSKRALSVVDAGAEAVGGAAKVSTMAALQPSTYSDILARRSGQIEGRIGESGEFEYEGESTPMSWGEAALKGYTASAINNFGEGLGGRISALGKLATKGLNSRVISKIAPSLSQSLEAIPSNKLVTWTKRIADRAGYNGMVSEFIEEQPATLLNALLVGDNQISDLLDAEQQATTALSIIAFGSGYNALNRANYKAMRAKRKIQADSTAREVVHALGTEGRDRADSINRDLASCTTIDQLGSMLSYLWESEGKSFTNEQRHAINLAAAYRARYLALLQQGAEMDMEQVRGYASKGDNPLLKWSGAPITQQFAPGVGASTAYLDMDERRAYANELSKSLRISDVKLFDRQEGVMSKFPNSGHLNRIIRGYYTPADNGIGLVLENLNSKQKIAKTLLHEAIGHKGVYNLFPDHGAELIDRVSKQLSPIDIARYGSLYGSDPHVVAKEYIANIAHGLTKDPSAWQNFSWNFRFLLRKQLGINIDLSDNDILFLLKGARDRNLYSGEL